jgi:phosphatidate cytidylyltransferase
MSMVDANPLRFWSTAKLSGGELALRVCSALVLAPLALGIAYLGGWTYVVFWLVAAMLVLWEWTSLVAGRDQHSILIAGGASVLLAIALAGSAGNAAEGIHTVRLLAAVTVLVMGMLGVAALAPRAQRTWVAGGIPYAGAVGIGAIVLRSDVTLGFLAIVLLFAIVWATDIFAYFIGRALGGPKLAPQFSPKKTWSGAIGGVVAAVIVAVLIARVAGLNGLLPIAAIAVLLSIAAQAGDLFESLLKRRFGAKDTSQLIPGHGGLMDRLDGFVAAAMLAALIGLTRGGLEAPARGLLMW